MDLLLFICALPVLFFIHDAEEVLTQRKWMQKHGPQLAERFPKARPMLEHLGKMTTKAFAIAALEELIVILLALAECYRTIFGSSSLGLFGIILYAGLYYAFVLHTLVHIAQCFIVGGYVPGLVTSILIIPVTVLLLFIVCGTPEYLWIVLFGIVVAALNLLFAHWLAFKICGIK